MSFIVAIIMIAVTYANFRIFRERS
jgi:hypothetical protein